ncbi:MAG: hypothetical protein RBR77_09985 [Thauera sp.]|jgi:DNA polymerase III delta prime subunit|nr:hypothetical protein [Thauera sp.]
MTNNPKIIVYGPQGCGKTTEAECLARHFGCIEVMDDWKGEDCLPPGGLVLTCADTFAVPDGWRSVAFEDAMAEISGCTKFAGWRSDPA